MTQASLSASRFVTSTRCGAAMLATVLFSTGLVSSANAQRTDTTKTALPVPVARADTAARIPQRVARPRIVGPQSPPLTTRRAFVYSLLVPGLGQSRLDRGTAGAFFAAIELGSWAMVRKTRTDLHEARRFSGDTLPNNYVVGTDGKLTPNGTFPNHFPVELVNTRRLHVEDWIAAIAFNHLISGADAFVAAQLWDVPATVSVRPRADGVAVIATVHW